MIADEVIQKGKILSEISDTAEMKDQYEQWCREVIRYVVDAGFTKEELKELKVKMHFTENEFSEADTRNAIKKAVKNTQGYLESKGFELNQALMCGKYLVLVEKILNNFYAYYRAMYKNPVHKRGTWKQEILNGIKIGNEYDLQRMVYALLLPIFPALRMEVDSDNGYGGMRADLFLEELSLIVEMKCTRDSMTEKILLEELGADGFHYRSDNIIFFIYDKIGIIKNKEAFQNALKRDQKIDGKTIKAIVLQPIEL